MAKHILIFDIWGDYAHFKKIYATTSAVSYVIPPKTALYGYVGAILGLSKAENQYLTYFAEKQCLIGIGLQKPILMKRLGVNLRPNTGSVAKNLKPTMTEYVYRPRYRIYFTHENEELQQKLRAQLQSHQSVFTPTLGLASLLSNFEWIGETTASAMTTADAIPIHSVIPRQKFIGFDNQSLLDQENELMEQSMFAVEMNSEREVTERDDILLDRKCHPVWAFVTEYYKIQDANIILF
ncbi:MAG: type I-B CRISPR-associated protein Cas5b [Bacteroidota bacterium]|nr:type I-B CRISPR-associated protein Cas5b [Bacteroidota bacterium]